MILDFFFVAPIEKVQLQNSYISLDIYQNCFHQMNVF